MINGTYLCKMKTLMGEINGKIILEVTGENLSGALEIMGIKQPFSGGKVNGDQFYIHGESKMMLGRFSYDIKGRVFQDKIEMVANTNKGKFNIVGKRC